MMKKLIAFDLDDTLAVTKSEISDEMSEVLGRLLEHYDVCVISGGNLDQFKKQVINRLNVSDEKMARMHLMPTCGTRYYRYENGDWAQQYAEDLSDDQKQRTIEALEKVAKELGLWEENPAGEIIEDRGSQITMSALGQQATPEDKYAWAEKYKDERLVLRDKVAELLPDLEVRIGGTTSTDVTIIGIDKAYGMKKLCEANNLNKEDILFVGDKLQEGGNDYPVKAMGIDSIEVRHQEDTIFVLEGVMGVTDK
jgi:HAD superfamily hydrolase (TIGR01484 family)